MSPEPIIREIEGKPVLREESELLVRYRTIAPVTAGTTEFQGFKDPARRIPFHTMQQVLAFMLWGYRTHKAEVLVSLYYNETTNQWSAWAPPQRLLGLSVERDLPERDKDFREQRKAFKGAYEFGSVHHHCGMPPGPSSQDDKDEVQRDGYHVTFGNLDNLFDGRPRRSLNCRSWVKGFRQFVPIHHMVAPHPDFGDEATHTILAECEPRVEFPDLWKQNVRVAEPTRNNWPPRDFRGIPKGTRVRRVGEGTIPDDFFESNVIATQSFTPVPGATKVSVEDIHTFFCDTVQRFFGAVNIPQRHMNDLTDWTQCYLRTAEDLEIDDDLAPEQVVAEYIGEWFTQYFPDGEPWNTAIKAVEGFIWAKISPCS